MAITRFNLLKIKPNLITWVNNHTQKIRRERRNFYEFKMDSLCKLARYFFKWKIIELFVFLKCTVCFHFMASYVSVRLLAVVGACILLLFLLVVVSCFCWWCMCVLWWWLSSDVKGCDVCFFGRVHVFCY